MTKLILKNISRKEIEIDDLRIAGKKIISIFLHQPAMEVDVITANPGVFADSRSAEVYEELVPLLPGLWKTNFGYEIEVGKFLGSFDTTSSYEDGFSIVVDKIVSDNGEVCA
ncbi:MAG: hypothetical protein Q4A21_03565 [bacterium]|nr:hypothetical protein [bacterium]